MELDAHGVEYSSSCSRSNRRLKYDVFLSFRGEDTRKGFTDHLYEALHGNGLITFRDEEELERGQVIKPSLLQAIEESFSAIVVLSENYATSTWCLDELVKILHSKEELGLHVFPIFYGVDPSDVRHQRGSFAEAFEKHEQKFAHENVKAQRWREALSEVADLAGWSSENCYETKLIEEVVVTVSSKLAIQPPFNSNDEGVVKTHLNDDGLVGIDIKIADFKALFLENTLEQAQFIGICGMGGLGKTTLARAVYERIGKNYDDSFFLGDVRKGSATDDGLIKLQEKLFSLPYRRIGREVGHCNEGKELIQRSLRHRKVLLVLDDVSDMRQLENLAGKEGWFGKGSTIIITTRDKHLLDQYGPYSLYQMDFLSHNESLQLFCQHAFKGDQPNEYYLELSNAVIKFSKGLPLALKVFGAYLFNRTKTEWEDALEKIASPQDTFKDIFHILKVSFDGLEDDEKNIFLDIACFFNGMAKENVKQMLENIGLRAVIGIGVLIEKSLVTEREGCLWVHDQLQEMGKKIVFLESPNDAGKRSRICSLEDATHVLGNKRGTEEVRGIAVRFDKPDAIQVDPEAFSSMTNLKLLIISCHSQGQLNLLHGLNRLSNTLKVIEWKGYPLDFLPSQTQFHDLVDLKMQHSRLKELWRGTQFLQSVKFVDVSHSTNLIRTPNFAKTSNLQILILKGCTKLVDVHHSLAQHKNLVKVDLEGCKSVKTLPTKLEMNRLETFILSGCSKVAKLPEFGDGMDRLSWLDLEGTAISKLPQSLVNLSGLANLNLKNCKNLVCLPSDFQKLKAIKEISVSGCSKFSRLPENLHENEALEEFNVCETAIEKVPSCPNNLKVFSFRPQRPLTLPSNILWSLPFSNLSCLVKLCLTYCNIDDKSLSSEIGNLSSLTILDLRGNNFVEFPSSRISNLRKLECIRLDDCLRLRSLPHQLPSSLAYLLASGCTSLKRYQYVRSRQLWEFIEQFECQTRILESYISDNDDWKVHHLSDVSSIVTRGSQDPDDFFMQPTRILNLPGCEVPSWFRNKVVPDGNVSFIVKKPDSCSSSEWWGIAVCLVLDEMEPSVGAEFLCWTYRDSEGKCSNSMRGNGIIRSQIIYSGHQLCIIHIRFSSFVGEQLEMIFFPSMKVMKIGKCGWRVVCKEDVESWRNKGGEVDEPNADFITCVTCFSRLLSRQMDRTKKRIKNGYTWNNCFKTSTN